MLIFFSLNTLKHRAATFVPLRKPPFLILQNCLDKNTHNTTSLQSKPFLLIFTNLFERVNFCDDIYIYIYGRVRFKDVEEEKLENVIFSSKRLKELGFEFKYSLDQMFTEAVDTCRAKGLLPSF